MDTPYPSALSQFTVISGYCEAVIKAVDLRIAVRTQRNIRRWSLDALVERSGVNRKAIHMIENVEKYPAYDPGLETLDRLIRALGMTWSEFVANAEGVNVAALRSLAADMKKLTRALPTISPPAQERGGSSTATPSAISRKSPRLRRRLS